MWMKSVIDLKNEVIYGTEGSKYYKLALLLQSQIRKKVGAIWKMLRKFELNILWNSSYSKCKKQCFLKLHFP